MAIDPVLLALAIHGRSYCGLKPSEAMVVAEKVVEIMRETPKVEDVADALDLFDDVWAASLLAGTISEGDPEIPVHPLTHKEHEANWAPDEETKTSILNLPDDHFPPETQNPEWYTDKRFIADKPMRRKERRKWLRKGGR